MVPCMWMRVPSDATNPLWVTAAIKMKTDYYPLRGSPLSQIAPNIYQVQMEKTFSIAKGPKEHI